MELNLQVAQKQLLLSTVEMVLPILLSSVMMEVRVHHVMQIVD